MQNLALFYEIRSSNNALLKHDGVFTTRDAVKTAGREDANKDVSFGCWKDHGRAKCKGHHVGNVVDGKVT